MRFLAKFEAYLVGHDQDINFYIQQVLSQEPQVRQSVKVFALLELDWHCGKKSTIDFLWCKATTHDDVSASKLCNQHTVYT